MSGVDVLVVDDSAVRLKLLEHALSPRFERVHLARNGCEALKIFERERPAMVITDCVMPDVGGARSRPGPRTSCLPRSVTASRSGW